MLLIINQFLLLKKNIKKGERKGNIQFKFKWLSYPEDQSTWEPEENILDKRHIMIKHVVVVELSSEIILLK